VRANLWVDVDPHLLPLPRAEDPMQPFGVGWATADMQDGALRLGWAWWIVDAHDLSSAASRRERPSVRSVIWVLAIACPRPSLKDPAPRPPPAATPRTIRSASCRAGLTVDEIGFDRITCGRSTSAVPASSDCVPRSSAG